MPGLLEGALAKAIYQGFKGKLLKGVLRRVSIGDSGGLDEDGDPIATGAAFHACQGFVDEYSDAFRAAAGIPMTDSKVCIFAKSLPAGVRPIKDDKVQMPTGGQWWQLRKGMTDPATALWTCQAFKIPAPDPAS